MQILIPSIEDRVHPPAGGLALGPGDIVVRLALPGSCGALDFYNKSFDFHNIWAYFIAKYIVILVIINYYEII